MLYEDRVHTKMLDDIFLIKSMYVQKFLSVKLNQLIKIVYNLVYRMCTWENSYFYRE